MCYEQIYETLLTYDLPFFVILLLQPPHEKKRFTSLTMILIADIVIYENNKKYTC